MARPPHGLSKDTGGANRRRPRLLGLWPLTVLFLAACTEADRSYYPLEGGMRWTYEVDFLTMAGRKTQRLVVENLHGVTLAGQRATPRRSVDGSIDYYRLGAEGVTRIAVAVEGEATRLLPAPEPVLRYPPRPGTWWRHLTRTVALEKVTPPEGSLTRIEEPLEMQYAVESTQDTVTVPAGRFEGCLRVRGSAASSRNIGLYIGATDIRIESLQWYAPGVGLVKALRRETTSEPTFSHGEYTLQLTALER